MIFHCGECGEELVPGEDWPAIYQIEGRKVHQSCNQKKSRGSAVIRRSIELGEGLSRTEYTALTHEEQKGLRRKYKGLPEVTPKSVVDPLSVRPTKEVPIPLPYFSTPTVPKARREEGPTRKALRNNKLYRHAVCEHTGYGPIRDLEFCHTMSFSVCMNHFDKPEWAADINNGFLLIACMNDPMKRGFHWEMDGHVAYYVPPEGEEYPLWMKRLDIPNFWIEPTPEQIRYILLANDHAMGIVY